MTTRSQTANTTSNTPSDNTRGTKVTAKNQWIGYFALAWGIVGVVALLSFAITRLLSISITAFGFSLTATHWLALAASVAFMAYAEGYRTFQKTWAPRVVGRAFELKTDWTWLSVVFAPFYCMSFFDATRKRMLTAWITTICIVTLVVLMNRIDQPWRGLIDAGVVVGLGWGVAAVAYQAFIQFTGDAGKGGDEQDTH